MKYIGLLAATFVLVCFILAGIQNSHKKSAKSTRLECHTQSVVFERVYEDTLLKSVNQALQHQNYTLNSSIKKAHYMPSKLFEYVDIKEVDQAVKHAIAGYQTDSTENSEKATINYYIYENDKDDPGKKTKKSKLYAGYLKFDVEYKEKTVYAIQIDFMDLQGKDISQRVECAVKSIMTVTQ